MATKSALPPTHHHPHLTQFLTPDSAQTLLATFLSSTQQNPCLHPDAQLTSTGITYAPTSGPKGGLTIHHLRRIEAGLRGEVLSTETEAELAEIAGADELPEGDDARLDRAIASGYSGKRGRSRERVEQWEDGGAQATTGDDDGWQDMREFEESREVLEGDIRRVEGAPPVEQERERPPVLLTHDSSGRIEGRSGMDKEERKKAKKERRKAEMRKAEEARKRDAAG